MHIKEAFTKQYILKRLFLLLTMSHSCSGTTMIKIVITLMPTMSTATNKGKENCSFGLYYDANLDISGELLIPFQILIKASFSF